VVTWLGYGQFLMQDRAPARPTGAWAQGASAFAIDDAALRGMLSSQELAPGRRIESVGLDE
jgi:hypothetical protein